eukprot:TRINITY_DN13924_c0_g1_i8.p1 TRINITY_DN13924_c0_g1~~TRINITY_DN13924_c0_g1_i8.p1  ORF type:complete len:196 (+),score=13.10 TRINITY_DN13924_c0_g1_i8:49-588(+)
MLSYQSLYYRLFNTQPTYTHLRTFGCVCFVHLPLTERTKLIAQSAKCVFLGYASHQKGFLCYDPVFHCIRVSRNVNFLENQLLFSNHKDSFPFVSLLPNFIDDVALSPLIVYERRRHKDVPQLPSPTDHSPPPDSPREPDPSSAHAPTSIQLRRSTHHNRPQTDMASLTLLTCYLIYCY